MNTLVIVLVALVLAGVTFGGEVLAYRARRRFTDCLPAMQMNTERLRKSVYENQGVPDGLVHTRRDAVSRQGKDSVS